MEKCANIVFIVLVFSVFVAPSFVQALSREDLTEEEFNRNLDMDQISLTKTDWWPMYQHDLFNSGYSSSNAPNTDSLLWTFQSCGEVNTPSVANEKIYFGTDITGNPLNPEAFLYCVDFEGTELWRYSTREALNSAPAIANDRVYIVGEKSHIYCLNADTGECIWMVHINGDKVSSPKVFENKIFFGTLNGDIYCLNAESGEIIWRRKIGIDIHSTPALVQNKLYISNYCIDVSNGNILWTTEVRIPFLSSPTIYNNTVYMGANNEFIYSINAENGNTVWDHYIGSMVWAFSPSSAYGNIYVGNAFGYLYCIDSTTGDERWVVKKSSRSISTPAISDGKVYIGSTDGNVYCFDAWTGTIIWNYQSNEPFECSPVVADGKMFIGSGEILYCFGEDQQLDSDLNCDGEISWSKVKPNSLVTSNFTITNIGKPTSRLDWKIESYPEWGNWTFSQMCGYDLEPNDGFTSVQISVVAPNTKKGLFYGNITIINTHNSSDYEILHISMSTMSDKSKDISSFQKMKTFYYYLALRFFQ